MREQVRRTEHLPAERAEEPLNAELLRRIERALHGKLRASRLSEPFIARHGEDAIQQGLAEYARALSRGRRIEDPGGWVVSAAFQRAIDALRREVREADDPEVIEAALARSAAPGPSPEEEAQEHAEARRLHEAIGKLSAEQRQALCLYYFEERTTREGAQELGCSEATFRRRLAAALRVLRERFGISTPEPGDQLAIEIGLAAWVGLAGARVVPMRSYLDQLIAGLDSLRGAVSGAAGRARDFLGRLLASGGGEGVGAVASGPVGRTAGACTAALAACVLSGVIGPGVGGVDLVHGGQGSPPAHHRAPAAHRPSPPTVATSPAEPHVSAPSGHARNQLQGHPRQSEGEASASKSAKRAQEAASSQFGIESAAPESAAPSPTPSTQPSESSDSAGTGESSPAPSPTQVGNEQFAP
jgi:RNA polymerase sigma-70 factor (ECF subfamily)